MSEPTRQCGNEGARQANSVRAADKLHPVDSSSDTDAALDQAVAEIERLFGISRVELVPSPGARTNLDGISRHGIPPDPGGAVTVDAEHALGVSTRPAPRDTESAKDAEVTSAASASLVGGATKRPAAELLAPPVAAVSGSASVTRPSPAAAAPAQSTNEHRAELTAEYMRLVSAFDARRLDQGAAVQQFVALDQRLAGGNMTRLGVQLLVQLINTLGEHERDHAAAATGSTPTRSARAAAPADAQAFSPAVDAPVAGDSRPGFIDNDDGANIRNRPAELAGSKKLTDTPLPPATRVFVSGRHPQTADWWYVTAFLPAQILRGYIQGLRITTDLPEPTAKLHEVKSGDTAEVLAVNEFSSAVRDGHDLRFYENVLLFVNRQRGRAGVRGAYQDPGLLGGGANNVQLEAGRRIWLVSPAYARALEGVVPDGSLTNGAVAKVKRFAGHVEDVIASVTQFPRHVPEVAGEYGQAIHDHAAEIIGVTAGFLMAEAASMALAATPGGQIPAIMIQLALAAFGAHGMAVATVEALKHAGRWLELAWNASGSEEHIAAASKEFIKMLVSIAMAALAVMGVKGNVGKAAAIAADSMPAMMPALAIVGGGKLGGASAGTAVAAGVPQPYGPLGTAMAMSAKDNVGESEPAASGGAGSSSADKLLSPSDVDAIVADLTATGRLTGDMEVLAKTAADAKAGQAGALGELEAVRRWIREGKTVEVMPEHQNAGVKNPDYRVNGELVEVKSRSKELNSRWLKDEIEDANNQIKSSGLDETGGAELQLRGDKATVATLQDVERQVLGKFKSTTSRSLHRIAVYKDGALFAEWRRNPDGSVVRTVPHPGVP